MSVCVMAAFIFPRCNTDVFIFDGFLFFFKTFPRVLWLYLYKYLNMADYVTGWADANVHLGFQVHP